MSDRFNANDRRTMQLYADYLRRIEWTHFTTLTFRNPVSSATAWKVLREWLHRVKVKRRAELLWFAVLEKGSDQERHAHLLIKTSPLLPVDALRSLWGAGISRIQRFDSDKPGIYYLTKTLNRDDADYDMEIDHRTQEKPIKMRKIKRKKGPAVECQLITVEEAAGRLSISRARCYELIRRNVLPAVALGRQKRIEVRALKHFIRAGGKGLADKPL